MTTKTNSVAPAATSRKILSTAASADTSSSRQAADRGKDEANAPPSAGGSAKPLAVEAKAVQPAAPTSPLNTDATPPPAVPTPAPQWSDEDENALQAMMARRKAAGFQRRGRDTSEQLLAVGAITPNPGTVVAIIVGLVAVQGTMSRGDLVAAMATATFPQAKARPTDRAWCQGYVAGALRDGFLTPSVEASPKLVVELAG